MRALDFLKNKWVAVPAVVVLILGLGFLAQFYGQGTFVGSDQVEYESNSEFFDGEVLHIGYIADKSTEEISAYYSEDDLESATGEDIQESVEIKVTEQDSRTRYTVRDTGLTAVRTLGPVNEIVSSDSDSTNNIEVANWADSNCADINGDGSVTSRDYVVQRAGRRLLGGFGDYDYDVYCVDQRELLGTVGDLEASNIVFETTWSVKAEGKPAQTATISNTDIGSGSTARIGDDVILQSQGALSTGKNSYPVDDELVLHTSDDQWRIISYRAHDDYTDLLQQKSNLYSNIEEWSENDLDRSQVTQEVNNQAYDTVEEFSASPLSSADCSGSFDNGYCEVGYEKELVWPAVSIYIDGGDYVTVKKPVGSPSITSVTSDEIKEIGGGQVTAEVRNTGDAEGSFSVRISECSNDFSSNSLVQTEPVPAGSSEEFSFWVSFDSSSDTESRVTGSCTVEAENSVGETVAQSVEVTGVQENKCTPGEPYRDVVEDSEVVRMCTSDGLPGEVIEECDEPGESVGYSNGELQCVGNDAGDEPGTGGGDTGGDDCVAFTVAGLDVENPFCADDPLEMLSMMFHLVAGTAVAFFTGSIGYRAGRWVDGEYQIKGGFDPLKSRSVSRIKRGRLLIGLVAGAVLFLLGFYVILLVPIWVQLMVILGYTLFKFYTPF